MEATQLIGDSILEEEEENGGRRKDREGQPLAKLMVLKNEHIPETELLLYRGENVMGRDPDCCSLTLLAPSVSKRHAVISISVFRGNRRPCKIVGVEMEALVWDLGSMNGSRKGRTKLTPHVRYALTEGDVLVLADIPCQYVTVDKSAGQEDVRSLTIRDSRRLMGTEPELLESPSPRRRGLGRETGTAVRQTQGGVIGQLETPSSTELGGEAKTTSRTKPLSFEQTPTQSEKILVADSESDSDGERDVRRDKMSNSDSHLSSPTCSEFLSPTSKVIPESEDESPITPRSAKDTPSKQVTVSEEDTEVDDRQQTRKRRAPMIWEDSEEEEEEAREDKGSPGEKETVTVRTGAQDVSRKVADQVGPADRVGGSTSEPACPTESRPALSIDSDTDVEGDEEGGLSAPVTRVEAPATTRVEAPATTRPEPGLLHTESHPDAEEGATAGRDSNLMLSGADLDRRPVGGVPAVQPAGPHRDGDAGADAATVLVSPVSNRGQNPGASVVQPVELSLDSDTDVEEDTNPPESVSSGIRTAKAVHQDVLLGSDTEEDEPFSPASSKTAALLNPQSTVGAAAALEIRSDSETEPEEDATPPPLAATTSTRTLAKAASLRSQDSDADTDVEDERLGPEAELVPESGLSHPTDFRMDSDTDVEEDEDEGGPGEMGWTGKGAALPSSQQKCSTPLASSAQEVMDTQDFSSLLDPFRRPALPPVSRPSLTFQSSPSASDSPKDEDIVVAETQSFVLEGRGQEHQGSMDPTLEATQPFHLGLSDSSHLQTQAQDQATESPPEGELEATQDYGAVARVPAQSSRLWATESTQAASLADGDSDLEATLEYGSEGGSEGSGPGRRSAACGGDRREDFALEATQAYANQPCNDTEEEETQPLDFPTKFCVATAETMRMSANEEEEEYEREDLVGAKPSTPLRRGRTREQETRADVVLTDQFVTTAQTLEMVQETDPEEEEEETKAYSTRRGQSQQYSVEKRDTQAVSSYLYTAETLPVFTADDDDVDEEDPRRSRSGRVEEIHTSSHISTAETQPIFTAHDDDDEEPRMSQSGRVEEIHTSSHISTAETQPIFTGHDDDDDDDDHDDDDEEPRRSQSGGVEEIHTCSHISTAETQPISTAETQPIFTAHDDDDDDDDHDDDDDDDEKKDTKEKRCAETVNSGDIRVQGVDESSESPKRQTRGKGKAMMSLRGGRRQKVLPEEKEQDEEETEVVEQGRRGRGKSVTQMKVEEDTNRNERVQKEKQLEDERESVEKEETERMEEKKKQEEIVRLEKDREKQDRMKRERTERKEQVECKRAKRLEKETMEREEKERIEREICEREEKERLDEERKEKKDKEQLDWEIKEREMKDKLECEKKNRKKQGGEIAVSKRLKMEQMEDKATQESEKEHKRGEKEEAKNEPETMKGRRASSRRVSAHPTNIKPNCDQDIPCRDSKPALANTARTHSNRTHSNSERATSSVGTQGTSVRERDRGGRKTIVSSLSEIVSDTPTRSSARRMAVGPAVAPSAVVEVTVQDVLSSKEGVAWRTRSRSSSTSSLKSDVSTTSVASVNSQSRGRKTETGGRGRKTETGGRGRKTETGGRGRKTETGGRGRKAETDPPSEQPAGSKATQDRSQKVEDPAPGPEMEQKEAGDTTRGRRRTAKSRKSDPIVAEEEKFPAQITEDPASGGRGRGRRGKTDTPPGPTAVHPDEGETSKSDGRRKKRELEEEEDVQSGFKVPRVKADVQRGARRGTAEETKDMEKPASPLVKRGRASTAQRKGSAVEETSLEGGREKTAEADTVQKKAPGRQSLTRIRKEALTENVAPSPMDLEQSPTGKGKGKRSSSVDMSTVAKTPRSSLPSPLSSLSPGTMGTRALCNTYKVLFTGVVDEEGEKVVCRLGGSLAKGVADMTHLVTDRVRRTVKFLCAVARGVPIVTTDWLDKSGKAGCFLSTDRFLVKDRDQENKFSFSLEESLRIASTQQLLQGYHVHVTRSVLPEPAQMKDIITCSGARFLPKMPSSEKPHTVVISCGQDWSLCAPALSASLPILTAEFLLTGILQQRVDLQTHILSAPKPLTQPGGRGRNRT
ncbi:mediator of DNA damage checkpoint protein 1 isoform X2 [Esox lucius]|uniref:mediator of DNA damage checkpoint protein 1 isoform X2 n=1 Tax=Esox lucius TaxID=8010 RepID=UPI001476BE6B|nr:mediator of DNA damage checkpoint protein 1 isoform X2 [Esox lucius]